MAKRLGEFELLEKPANRLGSLPTHSNPVPLRNLAVQSPALRSQPLVTAKPTLFGRIRLQFGSLATRTGNYTKTFLQVAAVLALIFGFLYFRRFHDLVPNRSGFDPLKLLIRRRFQTLSSAWFFEGMDKEMRGLVSAKTHTPEEAMVQLMCNELETATAELIVLRGALPPQMLQQTALTIPAP